MDAEERWKHERAAFRMFLATRDFMQLMDMAEDIQKAMEYMANKMDKWELLDREKFSEFMSRQW